VIIKATLILGAAFFKQRRIKKMNFLGIVKKILQPKEESEPQIFNADRPDGLALGIGLSTGELQQRGHKSGLDPNQIVWLVDDDCCQNICVMGGIGAGKTTRVINPLLFQLLNYQDVGGLIFDIKGDFGEVVDQFAEEAGGRNVHRIGVGGLCQGTNLLAGITPQQASGFLQSTFYLCGGATSDSFWIQSATALTENTLGLLQYLGGKYYNLEKAYQYIFFEDARQAIDLLINKVELPEGSLERRNLDNYKGYYENVFLKMDIKMRESIKGTLSTILSPFQTPELIDAFSGSDNDYDLKDILKGDVVLVDLKLAKWQTAGKVIYTLIKLRFFSLLQERQADKDLPQNFVFFMCDEYQDIISASKHGLSDLSFWDKSRAASCCGIISTQSVSSFRSAIGDPNLCDTILANFRQKIFFKTEDTQTLDLMNKLTGRVEVVRQSVNFSDSRGSSWQPMQVFSGTNQNNSTSVNNQVVERQLIDSGLVRQLNSNLVIALLNVEGESADDVLCVYPKYPKNPKEICQ
jgi:type IV secretory pathway TraG/TraD family ATPase VirD4